MIMPAVALRGLTVLPGMIAHFDISRNLSMKAVERVMMMDQQLFLVTQKTMEAKVPEIEGLYKIGIIANVKQVMKLQNNVVRVLLEGKKRAVLKQFTSKKEYLEAEIIPCEEVEEELADNIQLAMIRSLKDAVHHYNMVSGRKEQELLQNVDISFSLSQFMDLIANNIPVNYVEKQKILETFTITERYELLLSLLFRETEVLSIQKDFQQKVKQRVDKNQKEYILREQMALIREELGEGTQSDADAYLEAVEKLKAAKEVKERIRKEIKRFRSIHSNSSESGVSRAYIETLLEMPWNKSSKDNKDIEHAEQVLNADHYGLEKVKERVLEFLAVRNLTSKGECPIICLVGPPGTGKTSIARSVAKALNKEYVRICLGGVKDEAEIRGHRRTYVGAMPGRIASALRTATVKNPLILLDEIDKTSSDYRGDTSAALLEVLDGEQNSKFKDHYIEIPLDLSEVLFIATANSMQDIPKPLLDRMEVIEVNSYTENEKFHIAKEHLLWKQMEKNGLSKATMTISDGAIRKLIRSYTKEAGVRGLERKIGELCRKAAKAIYKKEKKKIRITETNLAFYLGKESFQEDKKNEQDEIGIVRGLAWTSVGGTTLEIEVNVMPGKGELKLTGQLGEVMKESAMAGVSYIRSIANQYKIPNDFFQEHDLHIHIPEGAIPKDGPSAGITMAIAVLSAIIQKEVRADVAMTGEITLRGRVLPIGGLKEKLLAAKNAEIKTVCIPKDNEKDLDEISKEITNGIEILPVKNFEELIKIAFVSL